MKPARGLVEPALQLITRNAPELSRDIASFRKAMEIDSPMVHRRFERLLRECVEQYRDRFTHEELLSLDEVSSEMQEGRSPQPRLSKIVPITMPPSYLARLDGRASEMGISRAELVRRALDSYLGEN